MAIKKAKPKGKKFDQDPLDEEIEQFAKKKELQNKVLIKIIEEINHKTKNTSNENP